ncbi:GIY-YIG nuclease family protein [Kitasatospora griseola]
MSNASGARGVTVRIFLIDGTPQGLRTVDRTGWTGTCLTFARPGYAEARQRPEVKRTGVYVLVGRDENDTPRLYVGEGDEVRVRLDSHHREKDFWTHGYVLTTKDDSLNKAHVRWLEARLLQIAAEAGTATLDNGTAPQLPYLSEPDQADMEWYLENALTLLPMVGIPHFEILESNSAISETAVAVAAPEGPTYFLKTVLTEATGRDDPRGFTVLEGAYGRKEKKAMSRGYEAQRDKLIADGILVEHGTEQLRLTRTHIFDSPSSAASVLSGGSKNGRDNWKDAYGRTLKQNQERATEGAAP